MKTATEKTWDFEKNLSIHVVPREKLSWQTVKSFSKTFHLSVDIPGIILSAKQATGDQLQVLKRKQAKPEGKKFDLMT